MSDLLAGLLSVALSTNPPAAASNLVTEKTTAVIRVVNTNDAEEADYRKVLEDDDAAEQDVLKWSDEADAAVRTGNGSPKLALNDRIRQRLDGVKGEYEGFLLLHPNHVRAHIAFASFLNDTHDEEGAVNQCEKARELDPKNPAIWNNLANYYSDLGQAKKAFGYYEKAIELDGHQSVYYHNMAERVYTYRADAREYFHATDEEVFDKALALYRKAIELAPDNFVLFTDYAECFYGINPPRWKEGLAAWTQALKLARDDVERQGIYIHLARIQLKLGQYEEARHSLDAITNSMYTPLKNRITRNLNDTINKAVNSGPAD